MILVNTLNNFGTVLLLALLTVFITTTPAQSQTYSLSGQIFDHAQNTLPYTTVRIETSDMTREMATNDSGVFKFEELVSGTYVLSVTHVGHEAYRDSITISNQNIEVVIRLLARITELEMVQVTAKSDSREAEEQSIPVTVANANAIAFQSATVTELMSRTSGVRIRQSGGLGSTADVSINGYQGRSVRYFKNGIPLSYLQDGYSITSVPVNVLDRVEVYKGVLPVSLGADALGGAVNLITKSGIAPMADISFEAGSFDTYRVSANGYYPSRDGTWYSGIEGFLNYSENNYKALVQVTDPDTRNQRPERVTMFHNAYNGYYTEIYAGLRNRKWTDDLRFGLILFEVDREQQHPALMTDPYGAVESSQSSLVPSLQYKKTIGRFKVDQFVAFNVLNLSRTDTLRGRYNWYGQLTPNAMLLGESRQPSLSDIDLEHITLRSNLSYSLNESHILEGNVVYTSVSRTGSDPFGPRFYNTDIDILSLTSSYRKLVAVIGLKSSFLNDRFETMVMLKSYKYISEGVEAWQGREITPSDVSNQQASEPGFGVAMKYLLSSTAFARFSAEFSNRLPEQDELFGDAVWIVPNFELSPERSFNINLGLHKSIPSRYSIDLNTFFRKSRGMILLVPVQPPYAQFANMEDIRGFGIESDLNVHILPNFTASVNVTWQDQRLTGLSSGSDAWKQNARLRNTPWFFSNFGLSSSFEDIISQNDRLRAYLNYSFVREFYLETIPKRLEPDGFLGLFGASKVNTGLIIPDQHLLSTGFGYNPAQIPVSIGLELKNVFNADIYDNYRVQRPGRSIHFKIIYQLTDNSKI